MSTPVQLWIMLRRVEQGRVSRCEDTWFTPSPARPTGWQATALDAHLAAGHIRVDVGGEHRAELRPVLVTETGAARLAELDEQCGAVRGPHTFSLEQPMMNDHDFHQLLALRHTLGSNIVRDDKHLRWMWRSLLESPALQNALTVEELAGHIELVVSAPGVSRAVITARGRAAYEALCDRLGLDAYPPSLTGWTDPQETRGAES